MKSADAINLLCGALLSVAIVAASAYLSYVAIEKGKADQATFWPLAGLIGCYFFLSQAVDLVRRPKA